MDAPRKIIGRPVLTQWLWLGAALVVLFTLVAVNLYRSYGRISEREQERLSTQAGVIASTIEFQLSTVNGTLDRIVADVRDGRQTLLARDIAPSYFSALVAALPGVRAIAVLDADGTMVAASHNELVGRNFTAFALLDRVQQHPGPNTLYVSSSSTRIAHTDDINIGRMIPDDDGGFAGMVFVTLDPPYLATLLGSVLYAQDMWGALTDAGGQAFVTAPAMVGSMPIGHPTGMVAQHIVDVPALEIDQPLVIALGRDQDDIFLQWREDLALRAMIFLLICVVSFRAVRAFQVSQRRSEQQKAGTAAILHATQENYRLIVENTSDLVARLDSQGRYTYLNKAFSEIDGKAAHDRLGEHFAARVVAADRELAEASFRKLFEPPFELRFTQREMTINGIRHFQWTAKALGDTQGKITEVIAIGRDMTDHMHRVGTLERQAYQDFLTGLINRRHFITLGREEISRASCYAKPPSLLMVDLDYFKRINDAYGHRVGDLILQSFSEVLLKTLRTTDIIARVGGEEFAVLLPETALDVAVVMATRLKRAVAENDFYTETAPTLSVTASIGVAAWHSGLDLEDLLDMADGALYQAKHTGRNKVCVANQREAELRFLPV